MSKFPTLSYVGKLQTAYDLVNETLADDPIDLIHIQDFLQNALVKINLHLGSLIDLILTEQGIKNDSSTKSE